MSTQVLTNIFYKPMTHHWSLSIVFGEPLVVASYDYFFSFPNDQLSFTIFPTSVVGKPQMTTFWQPSLANFQWSFSGDHLRPFFCHFFLVTIFGYHFLMTIVCVRWIPSPITIFGTPWQPTSRQLLANFRWPLLPTSLVVIF